MHFLYRLDRVIKCFLALSNPPLTFLLCLLLPLLTTLIHEFWLRIFERRKSSFNNPKGASVFLLLWMMLFFPVLFESLFGRLVCQLLSSLYIYCSGIFFLPLSERERGSEDVGIQTIVLKSVLYFLNWFLFCERNPFTYKSKSLQIYTRWHSLTVSIHPCFLLVEVVSLASRSIKTNSGEMEMAKEVLGRKWYEARPISKYLRYTAELTKSIVQIRK